MSTKIEPLLTIDDLDATPDDGNRYEIIEGELFVSRAPNLLHQTVNGKLLFSLMDYLRNNPIGRVWAIPGVIFSEFSGVIPDIVFVSNERLDEIAPGDRIMGAPDLAIEIVSPGADNERRDRIVKRQLYGKHQVKEYWILDPYQKLIEINQIQEQTLHLHATLTEQEDLTSKLLPGFACKVENIFQP